MIYISARLPAAETGPGRETAENAREPKTDNCAGLE